MIRRVFLLLSSNIISGWFLALFPFFFQEAFVATEEETEVEKMKDVETEVRETVAVKSTGRNSDDEEKTSEQISEDTSVDAEVEPPATKHRRQGTRKRGQSTGVSEEDLPDSESEEEERSSRATKGSRSSGSRRQRSKSTGPEDDYQSDSEAENEPAEPQSTSNLAQQPPKRRSRGSSDSGLAPGHDARPPPPIYTQDHHGQPQHPVVYIQSSPSSDNNCSPCRVLCNCCAIIILIWLVLFVIGLVHGAAEVYESQRRQREFESALNEFFAIFK